MAIRNSFIIIVWFLLIPFCCNAEILINPFGTFGSGSPGTYDDIIFYHDCDALDAPNKASDSTMYYDANWDLLVATNGGTAITGSDSWDNDNDGWENAKFEIAGNVDFASGRIGFYFRPQELAAGQIIRTNGDDLRVEDDTTSGKIKFTYLGTARNNVDDAGSNLVIGTTYFIEIEFNGSSATIYIDGNDEGTNVGTGSVDDTIMEFGTVDGNQWDAHFDQVISSNDPDRNLYLIKDVTNFD